MEARWNLIKELMPKMGRVQPPSDDEVVFVKWDSNFVKLQNILELIQEIGIQELPAQTTKVLLYKGGHQIYGQCKDKIFHDSRIIDFKSGQFSSTEYNVQELCMVRNKQTIRG